MIDLEKTKLAIAKEKANAWVMVDYENKNPTVAELLCHKMLTRKVILVIPVSGKPFVICHTIDTVFLRSPEIAEHFDLKVYRTWQEMLALEKEWIAPYRTILMDLSENGTLMRVSLADFGSVDYLRSLGLHILSSMNVMQELTAVMSPRGYALQQDACRKALLIKDEAFRKIKGDVQVNGVSDEYEIQQFICRRFHEEGMVYDDDPIVAIGTNANDPHYGPTKDVHSPIHEGDLVLIDMWAKDDDPEGVYADITWMGFVGKVVPEIYEKRFEIAKAARDGVIAFLTEQIPLRPVHAYEADDVARDIITKAGYGEYFLHRVGHNIAADVSPHGPGANLDDYETHDDRLLIEGTSFSDEPGIYAPDFGVRSETDLHVENGKLVVVGGLQDKVIPILAD